MRMWFGLVVLIIITGAVGYFFLNGIQNASLEKFELNKISNVDSDSFTLNGNLFVKNPSKSPIPIEAVEYDIYIKDTNEKIGSGTIAGFVLEANKVTTIPLNQKVRWVPTISLVRQLALKEKVLIEIRGKIKISNEQLKGYEIPFLAQTDIKEYMKNKITDPNLISNII